MWTHPGQEEVRTQEKLSADGEHQTPPNTHSGAKNEFPSQLPEAPALWTPAFPALSLQNCETVHVAPVLLLPPGLWDITLGTLGSDYTAISKECGHHCLLFFLKSSSLC